MCPTYDFVNEVTGETFEMQMSIADMEKYLEENKHIKQAVTRMTLGDSVRMGITKPPADFQKGVIGRMKEKIHGNKINSKFGIPREW
jgi:hypothetical protein